MAGRHSITPKPKYNLTGQVFGKLTALTFVAGGKWLCQCECGSQATVATTNLMRGMNKSCGCAWHTGDGKRTHGLTESAEYKVWCGIKRRCLNKNEQCYVNYGARGITICDRWRDSFEAFLADMGERPSAKHEIDRIDNLKGYEPSNCQWATDRQQSQNRRTNYKVTYNGETHCLMEWERITGIGWATIKYRLSRGWSAERALTAPVGK